MTNQRLAAFRARKDRFFATDPDSPLTEEQKAAFTGLAYFPENPALSFVLPLETDGPGVGERVELGTSDGAAKPFIRAGRIRFPVGDQTVTMTVFQEVGRGRFYLPFRDGTAGSETYPVGRYLDPQQRPDGKLIVDFNHAYNPYCAYGDGWSCPVPPFENVTKVRIEAGERSFPGERATDPELAADFAGH